MVRLTNPPEFPRCRDLGLPHEWVPAGVMTSGPDVIPFQDCARCGTTRIAPEWVERALASVELR